MATAEGCPNGLRDQRKRGGAEPGAGDMRGRAPGSALGPAQPASSAGEPTNLSCCCQAVAREELGYEAPDVLLELTPVAHPTGDQKDAVLLVGVEAEPKGSRQPDHLATHLARQTDCRVSVYQLNAG